MSNLKYSELKWDDYNNNSLMFIEFKKDGASHRWYPKWTELAEIINYAFATEGTLNNGRLKDYLTFVCLEPIFRQLSIAKCSENYHDETYELAKQYNNITDTISQNLLNKQAGG